MFPLPFPKGSPLMFPLPGSPPCIPCQIPSSLLIWALQSLSLPVAHPSPHVTGNIHALLCLPQTGWYSKLGPEDEASLHAQPHPGQDLVSKRYLATERSQPFSTCTVMEPTPSYPPSFLLGSTHLCLPDTHTQPDLLTTPEATGYKLPTRIPHLGQAWPDPTERRASRQQGTQGAPLGMMRPSGSLMSSVQRRRPGSQVGTGWRLSLMHIVVKGSWSGRSLGNVGQWVTGCQAMMPPLP